MANSSVFSTYLITPQELSSALAASKDTSNSPRVIPVSAAWFLPNDARKGIESFEKKHIPGSIFFDLDACADTSSSLPHMLPTANYFASFVGDLGIAPEDVVVVYDTEELGIFSAPRVAWTFQIFGHRQVHVLNNFRLWVQLGLPTESGLPEKRAAVPYAVPSKDERRVIDFSELRKRITDGQQAGGSNLQVLDARGYDRWSGQSPEIRPGVASGHMPFSINVPITDVLDPGTKVILPASRLQELLQAKGVNGEKDLVTSCGSGVTAAILELTLQEVGYGTPRVYDGSWT